VAIHSASEARLHVCNTDSSETKETKKEMNLEHTRETRNPYSFMKTIIE